MVELRAESNVLAGHVIKGCGCIPGLVRIAGVLGEIVIAGSNGRTIDRRQQHQIASGIVNLATAQREAVKILVEPQTVVKHEAQEILLGSLGGIARATHATAVFTSHIAGEREGGLAQEVLRMVVVFDLKAIVGVIPNPTGSVQRIFAQGVLIAENRQPPIWAPQYLPANSQSTVEPAVGLPSIDNPRFNLQMRRGENLHSHTVKKPRRI